MNVVVLDAVRRQYALDPGRDDALAPVLRLVPTGEGVRPRRGRGDEPPLRLTPFGRLVVAVLVAGVLSLLAVGLAGQLASAHEQGRTVTVRWGQTLSGIAEAQLPELPVSEGVVRLQLANELSTTQIHVGQHLVVPAP